VPARQKRTLFLGVAAAVAAALVLFTSGPPSSGARRAPAEHVVRIRGMLFQPARLQIAAGDSVTWINDDILLHAVKSTDPANPWQSKDLQPRQSWTKTFARSAPYFCPYHPPMTGQIVIVEAKISADAR
jgi:plastocyanin